MMHARQWLAHIKYTDALLDVHALFTGQKPPIETKERQFGTHVLLYALTVDRGDKSFID